MSGFSYVGTESQGAVDGKQKEFAVDAAHASVLGPGDVIRITGDSDATGRAEVDTGQASTANTGIVSAVIPNIAGEQLSITHLPATTAGSLLVNVDDQALYEVAVSNGPLAANQVGLNIGAVVTAGTVNDSVFTSNMGVDAATAATTATLPYQIVALKEDEAGVLGNRATVRVNASTSKPGATGI